MGRRWKEWVATLKTDTYALYLASRDRRVPWAARILVIVVVGYALSPVDLIPDFIPVLGYLDDMVLLPLGIALAIRLIPTDVWEQCREQARHRLAQDLARSWMAVIVIASIWLVSLLLVASLVFRWLRTGSGEREG